MVESGPFIEYCGFGYMRMKAVAILAVVSILLAFVSGFCTRGILKHKKSQG